MDCFGERTSNEMHVLTDLQHDDGDAAVLTNRHTLGSGDFVVLNELLERLTSKR